MLKPSTRLMRGSLTRHAMRYVLLTMCCLLLARPTRAQIGLYIYPDNPDVGCNFVQVFEPQSVYVVVTGNWRGARFALHDTGCVDFYDIQPMNGATLTGNLSSGIELSFPQCMTERYAVARVDLVTGGPCCVLELSAHPNAASGKVELIDCTGHFVPASWIPVAVGRSYTDPNCDPPGVSPLPRNPFPPDGATDVPLTTELSWMIDPPVGCDTLGDRWANVYFGTGSPLPLVADENIDRTNLPVGPLQPGTTYYWRVWVNNYNVPADGPVWSFRTATPVATEASTWGRIKSLYRN